MERIGLVAGAGELPIVFAEEARKSGTRVIGFALKGMASRSLDGVCEKVHWFSANQIKKFLFLLVVERIKKIVMLGKVDKSVIFKDVRADGEEVNFLKDSKDKSDYAILDRITSEFKKIGLEVIDPLKYLSGLFPPKGLLTKRKPSKTEYEDIAFGFKMAKEIAHLDIGQTVVVKDKTVITVEAMEGTDETIKRAAKLCGEGFIVVKVSRPHQDMRWDVPVAGPETIRLIAEHDGRAFVMEENKMFLIDRDASLKLADKNDISILVM